MVNKILIAGGSGFLGTHLTNKLKKLQFKNLVSLRSNEYDLRDRESVVALFREHKFDYVINLAALVGGIGFNQAHPYRLFYDNLMIQTNLIHESIVYGVKRFIQVGTTCSYPKLTPTPFREEDFWNGYPEPTNAPYGLAKRMGFVQLKAAQQEFNFDFCYLVPTNLYGPGDNFNPEKSHVIPALIRKFLEAVENEASDVSVWGTGKATRDFLYVEDAVDAIVKSLDAPHTPELINIGSGESIAISLLAYKIKELTGFKGNLKWDVSKPDGQPSRKLSILRARDYLGWTPTTCLDKGLKETVEWYKENKDAIS